MRYLALDWGKHNIGYSLGDDSLGIAFPSGVMLNTPKIFEEIRALCRKEGVGMIVIGLPKTLRGETGQQARIIEMFAKRLKNDTTPPIVYEDERFTTKIASKVFGKMRHTHADAIAASLILQGYFDRMKQNEEA